VPGGAAHVLNKQSRATRSDFRKVGLLNLSTSHTGEQGRSTQAHSTEQTHNQCVRMQGQLQSHLAQQQPQSLSLAQRCIGSNQDNLALCQHASPELWQQLRWHRHAFNVMPPTARISSQQQHIAARAANVLCANSHSGYLHSSFWGRPVSPLSMVYTCNMHVLPIDCTALQWQHAGVTLLSKVQSWVKKQDKSNARMPTTPACRPPPPPTHPQHQDRV
jgi:hypothetical protein